MDDKTTLVHIDDTPGLGMRTAIAAELARTYDAHLIGVTQSGISQFVYRTALCEVDVSGLTPLFEDSQAAEGRARLRRYGPTCARQFDRASGRRRGPGYALATQAMYADLIVLGQAQRAPLDTAYIAGTPAFVAVHAPFPVRALPSTASRALACERIRIAWNASPEAARAVRMEFPFLKRTIEVRVAIVNRNSHGRVIAGGNDIALFLARHGGRRRSDAAG